MSGTVKSGVHTLAYAKTGSGPAVVLIHGIGGHKEDWTAVASSLAGLHTVYAVDMLGFRGSPKTGEAITIADQVAALLALLHFPQLDNPQAFDAAVVGFLQR